MASKKNSNPASLLRKLKKNCVRVDVGAVLQQCAGKITWFCNSVQGQSLGFATVCGANYFNIAYLDLV
jgi:hypothetical protein